VTQTASISRFKKHALHWAVLNLFHVLTVSHILLKFYLRFMPLKLIYLFM